MRVLVLPSLLAADVGNLRDGARRAEQAGADALHIDIMDAHFVPNLSMGPAVVKMAKKSVTLPLSVHLMMTNPDKYLNVFIDAGADSLLIHIEAECDIPDAIDRIRDLGARPGITLNPGTPANMVFPILDKVDEVLVMTVQPGYGGQAFMADQLPKIREIRKKASELGMANLDILVDGGINTETAVQCAAHGANSFIAGTSLYRVPDMAAEVRNMRDRAAGALVA